MGGAHLAKEIGHQKTAVIAKVVRAYCGEFVNEITRLHGGVVNEVFSVLTDKERLVMRLNKDSLTVFLKERWAMKRACEQGVQVPEVFDIGEVDGLSYMLMAHAPGVMLSHLSDERGRAFTSLGEQIRRLHNISVEGYGFHLDLTDSERPHFTEEWADVVTGEHKMTFANSSLLEMGALSSQQIENAIEFLKPMAAWHYPPLLCHGDLNLSNVLVDDAGAVTILDWTGARGGPGVIFDLSGLAMNNQTEFEAFCLGYGLNVDQQCELAIDWQRNALKDVLRAAAWAHSVQHEKLAKFAADAQDMYRKIFQSS